MTSSLSIPSLTWRFPVPYTNVFGPGKLNDNYQPYHINGNILSYPVFSAGTFEPPDVGVFEYGNMSGSDFVAAGSSDQPIWAENAFVVGGLAAEQTLNFSNTIKNNTTVSVSDTHKTSTDVSVTATVKGSYGIFSGSVSSTYKYNATNSHSFTDTRSASRTNSTSVEIAVNIPSNIPAERGYKFFPAWYTTPGGAYKVTHAVSTTEIGEAPRLFWENTYQKPDPALSMPHRIVADSSTFGITFYRLGTDLSRKKVKGFFVHDLDGNDLFGPPADGEVVSLDLRVYNLSVASPVCGLTVAFELQEYYFGQEIGPRIPLDSVYIPYISARGGEELPCPTLCKADLDANHVIDEADVALFVEMLLNNAPCIPLPTCCVGDTNDDGNVDGRDIDGFLTAMLNPVWEEEEDDSETELGAPENMRYARITWDTTGFGPIGGTGLRTWLIYATLDPDNTIPDETHEYEDRYDDPLRNYVGQPIEPLPGGAPGTYLEKAQNNTGWISVTVAPPYVEPAPECAAAETSGNRGGPRAIIGAADIRMSPDSLVVVDPATMKADPGKTQAAVNERLTLRVAVHADVSSYQNQMLRVYDGDPGQGGKLIVNRVIMGIDADNGTYEFFAWQPTSPGLHTLYAEIVEPASDKNHGNARDILEIEVIEQPQ